MITFFLSLLTLIALRNPFTAWCVRMGCNADDHPEHERQRKASRPSEAA